MTTQLTQTNCSLISKLDADTRGRQSNQLQVFRACRAFSPAHAASISIQELRAEVDVYFRATPFLAEVIEDLLKNVWKHHQSAVSHVERWKHVMTKYNNKKREDEENDA